MRELLVFVLARPLAAIGDWITKNPGKTVLALLSILLLGGIISSLVLLGGVLVKLGILTEEKNLVWDLAQWAAKHRKLSAFASLALLPFFPIAGFFLFLGLVFETDNWK